MNGEGSSTATTRIARVDGAAERMLAARFGITGFPTLFYLDSDGITCYKYSGLRDLESISSFLRGGTKTLNQCRF